MQVTGTVQNISEWGDKGASMAVRIVKDGAVDSGSVNIQSVDPTAFNEYKVRQSVTITIS